MGRIGRQFNLGRVAGQVALLAVMLAACGRHGRDGTRDRAVITAEEMATIEVATAYDVVRRLRGDFLRPRGTVSRPSTRSSGNQPTQAAPSITVFVDGVESGPIERTLHLIPATEVAEIRLYRPVDAATKYGTRHNGGVIDVITKRHDR